MGFQQGSSHAATAEANRKKKDLFFPSNKSANDKPGTLFTVDLLTSFSPLKRVLLLPCAGTCIWLTIVANPELQFFANPK